MNDNTRILVYDDFYYLNDRYYLKIIFLNVCRVVVVVR